MKSYVLIIVLFFSLSIKAQKFLKKPLTQAFAFKEMQRQFNQWAKTHDLKKEKNWKYFKRWEMEMQLHTDAQGELTDQATYVHEAVKAAKSKALETSLKTSNSTGWYPIGPNFLPNNQTGYMENGIGRINCIAFDPTDASTYYVGVAQGGLWKTSNNGVSWTPLTDNLPITRISDICIDPNNTSTMYISVCDFEYIGFGLYLNGKKRNTHFGLGVYKTTDGGLTWQPTGLSFQLTNGEASLIRKVLVKSTNSNTLLACGVSGMYRSVDAGLTWSHQLDSLCWDLVQDPVSPNTVYAATGWVQTANKGYAAVYKSTDFGLTWTMLNTSIPGTHQVQRVKLAIAPTDNNYIYAITVDTIGGFYGIYKSTDAGINWQFQNSGLNILEGNDGSGQGGQGNYDLGFMVSAQDKNLVYVGGVNMWGSNDGAVTFNPVCHWTLNYGPTIHGDIHFIQEQPLTGNLFVCSDGGVYRTSNLIIGNWADANSGIPWPTQWTKISDGMAISSFYRISSSGNSTGRLMTGAQDNGSFYYDGASWNTVIGGDGMDNYLDSADDNIIIGSSQYGNFELSTDNGSSYTFMSSNVNGESGEWTTPFVADYHQPGVMYSGYVNVNQSTDGGFTWSSISSFPVHPPSLYENEISALAVANSNSNVIYAAKRVRYEYGIPGAVFVTTDGGTNWTDITLGLPDSLYYTSITVNETNANEAYVTMAQFSAGNKVFRTIDGGSTWQNISYNLPNVPVNCIKNIPGTNDMMLATDFGIYVLSNGSTTWVNNSVGLPNVIITDIEFNKTLNKIYISTFGRSIWAADLDAFTSIKTQEKQIANFELFPTLNNGTFTIKLPANNSFNEELLLEIIDVTGRVAYTTKLSGQSSYSQQLSLPAGMYFAKVKGKKVGGVKNFIVE